MDSLGGTQRYPPGGGGRAPAPPPAELGKDKAAATSPANYRSGKGIEHRQHFRQDLKMLKGMGLNSLRFSIEWSALEPREGEWDDSAFAYYDEYFDQLERLGI